MSAPEATPWVDPDLLAAGKLMRERGLVAPLPMEAPVPEVRAAYDRIGAFLCEGIEPLARERDAVVPGPHGPIRCRIYLPEGASLSPALVYLHGGGFAFGSIDSWDGLMRDLVRQSGAAAVNVEYRLSPEHRFPVQFDECLAVVRHFAARGADYGIDGGRLAAGGDSAGANLVLAAACALRDANERALKFLLLFYGVYSADMATESWRRLGTGAYGLSAAQMEWIWSTYLNRVGERLDWRAAPLNADLAGLPPVFINAASLDPLLDDAHALQRKLDAAGVRNRMAIYDGVNHGFIRHSRVLPAARRAVADGAAALRAALA